MGEGSESLLHSLQNFCASELFKQIMRGYFIMQVTRVQTKCGTVHSNLRLAPFAAQLATFSYFFKLPSFHFLLLTPTPARTSSLVSPAISNGWQIFIHIHNPKRAKAQNEQKLLHISSSRANETERGGREGGRLWQFGENLFGIDCNPS